MRVILSVIVTFLFPFLFFSTTLFAEDPKFPQVKIPASKLFVGEKLVYKIKYLGLPVGRSEAWVKEIVEIDGREAYHIQIKVRSHRVIDLVYKVRDEHHVYIDVEKLYSLRFEKRIREGRKRLHQVSKFDQAAHKVQVEDFRSEEVFEDEISENVQDEVSCGYYYRTFAVEENSAFFIPVYVDGKNWNLEVKTGEIRPMHIGGIGHFQAMEIYPLMEFQGIFFRRGKITGWMSQDERRLPIKMKVRIPVLGNIVAVLSEYEAGV